MKILRRIWQWIDDRTGITEFNDPLLHHPVPPDSNWFYIFGSATLFCFILQIITGIGLSFMYQPSTGAAYDSLNYIDNQTHMGHFLRAVHYYGASAMILFIGIHMIRVYLLAAFKYPREMSWISGSVLLLLTVTMGFTGQLLRWDSNGVWSAVVAAEQAGRIPFFGTAVARTLLGGDTITGFSVSRFFSIHVFLIPALMFGLIGLHLYLVIRNGISELPKSGQKVDVKNYRERYQAMLKNRGLPFWPDVAWREVLFGILLILVILVLAFVFGPVPIGKPPDPADIIANPRPDWYFIWVFALFALMPREIESFAIAFGPVILGLILILLPIINNAGERSPFRRPWAIVIVIFIVTTVASLWHIGLKAPWSPAFNTKPLTTEVVGNVDPSAKTGADLFYKKACIYCHSISGHGGTRGPSLTDVGDRLTENEIIIRIAIGGGNMPAFGGILTNNEIRELVHFLMTRKTGS